MNSKRWRRFLFCSDLHGDMQDRKTVETLLAFKRVWRPEVTIFGGDLWDFRSIRRKASEEDKRDSLLADYQAGTKFLNDLRPDYFLRGNHDERLWYWRDHGTGVAQDFAAKVIGEIETLTNKLNCKMLPYHRRHGVLRIGKLKMLHGYFTGETAAKRHVLVYQSCLFGHTHAIDVCPAPGLDVRIGRAVGCLCNLEMEYDACRPTGMRQAHGFAYGFIDRVTGAYKVYQAEQLGGTWLLPTEFSEFR